MSLHLGRIFHSIERAVRPLVPLAINAFAPAAAPLVQAFSRGPSEDAPDSLLDFAPDPAGKVGGAITPILQAAYDELEVFRGEAGGSPLSYGALKVQQVLHRYGGVDSGVEEEPEDEDEEEE